MLQFTPLPIHANMPHIKAEALATQLTTMHIDGRRIREVPDLIASGEFGREDIAFLHQTLSDVCKQVNIYDYERARLMGYLDALCLTLLETGQVEPDFLVLERLLLSKQNRSLSYFLSHASFVSCKQSVGYSLLYTAITQGRVQTLKTLIDGGVDVNYSNPEFQHRDLILYHAIKHGNLEIFNVLLEAGLDIHGRHPMHNAISCCASVLLKRFDEKLVMGSGTFEIMCKLARLGAQNNPDLDEYSAEGFRARGWHAAADAIAGAMAEYEASSIEAATYSARHGAKSSHRL